MSLLAHNLTGAIVTLPAGNPPRSLPPSPSPPIPGPALNVTSEMQGLSNANWLLVQAQITGGLVYLHWTDEPEYPTGTITLPTVSPSDISYTPTDPTDWLSPSPTTLQGALDALGAGWGGLMHTIFVSKDANAGGDGSFTRPLRTIQAAINLVPEPTTALEESTPWVIVVGSGCYDEDLTIGTNRYITILALGTVVLGDGVLINMGSTVPRNINWYNDYRTTPGPPPHTIFNKRRPSLSIGAVATTEANVYSPAYACCMMISGSIIMTSPVATAVAHQLQLFNVVLKQGIVGTADLDNAKMVFYRVGIEGTINAPNADITFSFRPNYTGLVTVKSGASVVGGYIAGGITVTSGNLTFFDTNLLGTYTLPGASLFRVCASSYYYFKANGCVLVGPSAPTLVTRSTAPQVDYSPAVLVDWSGVAPTSLANALDRIAAKITPIP